MGPAHGARLLDIHGVPGSQRGDAFALDTPTPPAGYRLIAELRAGVRAVIYRAIRLGDAAPVLLKTPCRARPTEGDIAHLTHELAVLTHLAGAPVARALAMEVAEGRPWLVLEDPGGQSLDRIAARFRRPEHAVALGAKIAAVLAEVHRRGVVHRDMKPSHVIVLDDGSVRLTGFRFGSLLRVDSSATIIQGSLAYMAPEQTGRMSQPVDKRADLYALGVTLYELLTGRLPFEANDPLGWVHAHIAKAPPPPRQLDERIPASAEAIILKLLSKHGADRYRAASGLQKDLERCAAALERGEQDVFPIGMDDLTEDFRVGQRLYGRRVEVARLLDGFEAARSSGSCALTLVGGYAGVGKTSLVAELYEPIVRERGRFVAGKFDQYKRDIPYTTIVQAIRDLLRGILAAGETSLERWRDEIQEALGVNGRLIIDVIPELELLVGPQPPVPELDPHEGQNRFELVFVAFIRVFARPNHPLIVFLDDMQWADGATLGLLKTLAQPGRVPHLQLILAYRSNEVDASHPFQLMLDAMRARGSTVDALIVLDLEADDVLRVVADTVARSPADAAALANVVRDKTGGNPFFVGELLQVLHARGLLRFDVDARGWTWDDAAIRAVDVTANVVDLLVDRMRDLPAAARRALTMASCFGSRFDLRTLATVLEVPLAAVEAALLPARSEGFVAAVDDAMGARRTLRFAHDRIQQAAYSLLTDVERTATHVRIGRVLRAQLASGDADVLFDAVKHLDHGAALLTDPGERQQLVELNLLAGRRAKMAIAWEPARVYLEAAASLLGDLAWSSHYTTTFAVLRELAECECLCGRFASAEARFDELRRRALSPAERADIATLQVKLYVVMGRYDEALRLGLAELAPLNESLPAAEEDVGPAIVLERERLASHLAGLDLRSIVDRPVISDPQPRALIILLTALAPPVYSRRPALFPLLAMRIVNLSLEHGNCEHSCFGYSLYAMVLAGTDGDAERALALSEASIALNERFRDPKLRGTVLHVHANHIMFWRRPYAEASPLQERAFLASMEVGDLTIAAYVSFMAGWQCLERGASRATTEREIALFEDLARGSKHEASQLTVRLQRQFGRALGGLTDSPMTLSDDEFDADEARARIASAGFDTGLVMHDLLRVMLAWHHGHFAAAQAWLARGFASLPAAFCLPLETTWVLFDALTAAALWDSAEADERPPLLARVVRADQRFKGWAGSCRENFSAQRALVGAELARLDERTLEALRGYELAADEARHAGRLPLESIATQLGFRLARASGLSRATTWWSRDSRDVIAQWGAAALLAPPPGGELPSAGAVGTADSYSAHREQLDVLTAIKASQALSRETSVEGLTRALLQIVLEHAGAQRTILLLVEDGRLQRAGAASIDGEAASEVPESVVRYAERTCSPLVLADALADPAFGVDEYIARTHQRSLLCLPILVHSRLGGLLYLENSLIVGAFSPERLALLEVVATQLAISLENARLYQERQARAEQAAREEASARTATLERSRLLALFEQAPAAILVLEGPDHLITLANPSYRRMVGDRPLKNLSVRDAFPEMEVHGGLDILDRVFHSGEAFEGRELLVKIANGPGGALEERSFDFVYQPFRGTDGRVQGIMVFAFDASEQVRARDERQALVQAADAARSEAESANRSKDEFLAMLGHELRNPLAPILTALHLMRQREGDQVEKARLVIERQVKHLVRLVDDLLDVSRIASGKIELTLEQVELFDVVSSAIELASPLLEKRSHRLVNTVPQSGLTLDGDPVRLGQVVANLLSNAAKYTESGGVVTVAADRVGADIELFVRDTGIGITREMLPKVFELFAQETQSLARSQGGLGLGLAIVRSLVTLHGGSVSAHSAGPGQGSEFRIRLPASVPALRPSPPALPSSAAPSIIEARAGGSRVLIVDDNEDAAELLAMALGAWGYATRVAHDGPSALREALEFEPQVALLDIGLPVIDGYELARLFKQDAKLKDTWLVALTGYGSAADRQRSNDAGFDVHLAKPVDMSALETMLSSCFKRMCVGSSA